MEEKAHRKQLKKRHNQAERAVARAFVPISSEQLVALLAHVEAAVESFGCDHTSRAVTEWAANEGVDAGDLNEGLQQYGGFCDCEVAMNVHPDEVF